MASPPVPPKLNHPPIRRRRIWINSDASSSSRQLRVNTSNLALNVSVLKSSSASKLPTASPSPLFSPQSSISPSATAQSPDNKQKTSDSHNNPALLPPPQPQIIYEPASSGPSNKIRTSKYTLISFLPKNLYEQFRSIANFYFLSLVVLQAFPPFSQVSAALTAAPILLIVLATAIKDAIEDWRRHKSDDRVNSAKTYVLANARNWNFPPLSSHLLSQNKKRLQQQPTDLISVTHVNATDSLTAEKSNEITSNLTRPKSNSTVQKQNLSADTEGPFWQQNNWEDVRSGDFVYLQNNESIPADVFIVSTSEPENACYLETKQLDGETNLKVRRGLPDLAHIKTPFDCIQRLVGRLDCESPSPNLFSFNAVISLDAKELHRPAQQQPQQNVRKMTKTFPIGMNSMLLRGCVLRNTKWVIGIVIYTGTDTKIMKNSGVTPSKQSKIDKQLNPLVLLSFWILGAMCIICSLICSVYTGTFIFENALFNPEEGQYTPVYAAFVAFFLCLINFQNIVPISLYISVDISKIVQSIFMSLDVEMHDKENDIFASPRAWNLSDDLGQIEYIFSDKTGTLTCNTMEFRKCSINGVEYGGNFDVASAKLEQSQPAPAASTLRAEAARVMKTQLSSIFDTKYLAQHLSFVDTTLPEHLKQDSSEQSRKIREFFSLLAICHTVLVEKRDAAASTVPDDSSAENPNFIEYRAQSPDEAALVAAARDVGFAFLRRTDDIAEIDLMGSLRSYKILNVLEFNSDRKRMSVIIRRPEGQIILLVKGADSVIFERLAPPANQAEQIMRETTLKHLQSFANDGLRTLCLAHKVLPQYEYDAWNERYCNAQNSIQDREKNVDAVAELIEKDLTMMGATAIEDKLQEGVPETIGTLAKAGIKIWVLTGDKMETAINIGFAANLLKKSMVLIVINSSSLKETFIQLLEALEKFWYPNGAPRRPERCALVIDGTSLKYALNSTCRLMLLEIGCRCQAVICCRVSPLQKARVVSLVRKGLGVMCLAIGDGANDVSMIQEADIGIGISGKEGMQAVMASDYAIGQFRFLGKLLLVHGRWGYIRTGEIIFNYFYKNAVWLFLLLWYQFDCGFSADLITDFTYGMFFNTLFTLFPTMFIGFFEQDLNAEICLQVPQIYQKGMRQQVFNIRRYWTFMADALWQSVISYFLVCIVYRDSVPNSTGRDGDHDSMGAIMSHICIICVNIHAAVNTTNWTFTTFFGLFASYFIWLVYVLSYSTTFGNPPYGQLETLYREPHFYLTILIGVVVSLMPRFICKFAQQYFLPSDTDILQEVQKYHWTNGTKIDADIEKDASFNSEQISPLPPPESLTIPQQVETQGPVSATLETAQIKYVNSDPTFESLRRPKGDDATKARLTRSHSENSLQARTDSATERWKSLIMKERVKFLFDAPPAASTAEKRNLVRRSVADVADLRPHSPDGFDMFPVRRQHSEAVLRHPPQWITIDTGTARTSKQGLFAPPAATPTAPATSPVPRNASIYFMGTNEECANTGFCFSHGEGMMDLITPTKNSRPNLLHLLDASGPAAGPASAALAPKVEVKPRASLMQQHTRTSSTHESSSHAIASVFTAREVSWPNQRMNSVARAQSTRNQ
ncbi:hypothetical protein HDU82_005066 [Entophlyctis luteolus]|nr:hypothetical protein HDU82_005066 [Entophlyctis luteolus]